MLNKNLNHRRWLMSVPLAGVLALPVGALLPVYLNVASVQAQESSDRPGIFVAAPRLIRSAASFPTVDTPSTYQFTITVPENAGAPLKAIKIVQDDNLETVEFNQTVSSAFLGDSFSGGTDVPVMKNIGGEAPTNPGEVTVVFDQPIQPGQTVTVSLETNRNPHTGGAYHFGVTAYPIGENSTGLNLGYTRVNLYDNFN